MAATSRSDFLIVDDSEAMRTLEARMIKSLGYDTIYVASSGKEAINVFRDKMSRSRNPVVLMDPSLSDVSGDIVAKKIFESNAVARIIVVTAEDRNEEVTREVIKQGAFGYVQKPIRLSVLRDLLEGIS